jgi:hypothetical protein
MKIPKPYSMNKSDKNGFIYSVKKQNCQTFPRYFCLALLFLPNSLDQLRDIFIDAHLIYFKEILKKNVGLWFDYEVIIEVFFIWSKADIF